MMQKMFLTALVVCQVTLLRAQTPEKIEDEKSIRRALEQWVVNFNNQEFEKTFEIWSPELEGWYPGQKTVTFAESTTLPSKESPKSLMKLEINEIMIDGSLAVVRDTWEQTIKSGENERKINLKSFEVWKKNGDGKWKIVRWISYPQ